MPDTAVDVRDKIYVDGSWIPSTGKGTIDVFDSTDGSVIGTIPDGTADDVDKAAKAARAAFDAWSQTSPEERGKFCTRIGEGLARHRAQPKCVVEFAIGQQSGIGGHRRAAKLQHDPAVEIELESLIL